MLTRRQALTGSTAVAACIAVPATTRPAVASDTLRQGIQVLVNEIRQHLKPSIITSAHWALQEAADRLEALPGIQPVPNKHWETWRADYDRRYGPTRNLRPVREARS